MHNPETSGRMLNWAIELGQFHIKYKPINAIKGKTLVYFVLEFPFDQAEAREEMLVPVEVMKSPLNQKETNKMENLEK